MRVSELMSPEVITVGKDAPVKEAARRMIEAGVSGLLVTGAEGQLEGVITEADFVKTEAHRRAKRRATLLRWLHRDGTPPAGEKTVADAMTADVVTIGADDDHAAAARLMARESVKRLPVLDADGNLVGILSRADILRAFNRSDKEILEEITESLMPKVLWIDPKRVTVQSEDGNVTLRGKLETRSDADLLTEMIGRLDGVVSVDSHLTWDIDNTRLEMTSPPPPFSPGGRPNW